MQKFFRRLSLSKKIVLPLLIVCLSIFMLCLVAVGQWFTDSLEQNFRKEVESFAQRVEQDFKYEQQNLETKIELISSQGMLRQAVEQHDKNLLLQILLPLKSVLKLDWIKVVDSQGKLLIDTRINSLSQVKLLDETITNSTSNGAHLIDFVTVESGQQVLQVVTHGIKSSAGLLGGIIIGYSVDNALLEKIAVGSSKHLIVVREKQVVATTLAKISISNWRFSEPDTPAKKITIDHQNYLAKSITLKGASNSLITTVLYPISLLEIAQWKLWQNLGILFLLGSMIVAFVGLVIARTITRPLQNLTQVAYQVTQNSDFELQVLVTTEDEVGILALAFNQLIQQVRKLLIEQQIANKNLAAYSQTLEQKVEERTQALKQKNLDLKETLQELQHTQAQLIQHEKMSSLGRLVAGIAHEINNPVNFIYGNIKYIDDYTKQLISLLQLYQKNYPNPAPEIQDAELEADLGYLIEDLPKILISMKIGSERIREIVLSLRIFSRLDEAEFKTVDLHQGIDSTLLILQHRIKAQSDRPQIKIVKEYGEIPETQCFAGQLNQVFMNILANAIDALEDAFDQDICPHPVICITSAQVNENIVIKIADNGIGIPEKVRSHLFEPFFTTKPVGKGTGMGLSISYQIICEKHGGLLECISSPGKGTEFVITIPIR